MKKLKNEKELVKKALVEGVAYAEPKKEEWLSLNRLTLQVKR